MKSVDIGFLSEILHFPIMQAVPIKREQNWFKRFIKFINFRRRWKVTQDYCLWVPELGVWIFVPAYFINDCASVPKILNGVFSPTGMLLLGAVPHDFGYRYQGLFHVDHLGRIFFAPYTKKELDNIFDVLCTYESGMPQASGIATFVLSLVGFLGWRENRKANRVLINDFPEVFVGEDENDKEQVVG